MTRWNTIGLWPIRKVLRASSWNWHSRTLLCLCGCGLGSCPLQKSPRLWVQVLCPIEKSCHSYVSHHLICLIYEVWPLIVVMAWFFLWPLIVVTVWFFLVENSMNKLYIKQSKQKVICTGQFYSLSNEISYSRSV